MTKKKKHKSEETQPEIDFQQDVEPQAEETPAEPLDPIEALTQERDDLLGRLQRLAADYQNYQKRAQKDNSQARDFANESLVKELLPVLDDMERAIAAAGEADEDDPFLAGMKMVHDNMLNVLMRFGLEPIVATGETFNPEFHSALMQQPTDEVEPMTVLQEVQKGYTLKGRALRPAGVIVSKAPEEEQEATEE